METPMSSKIRLDTKKLPERLKQKKLGVASSFRPLDEGLKGLKKSVGDGIPGSR